jgi:hypothetical protein
VHRGSRSLVIGAAGRVDQLAGFAADLDAAALTVDRAWGEAWPRTVVALVPADLTGMAAVLGPGHDVGLAQLAAVTSGDLDVAAGPAGSSVDGVRPTADRVVLNPTAFAGLGPVAREVVLTHEVTHLATRASRLGSPDLWLQEGFADYVAYRDSGLDRAAIAGDLLTRARQGELPTALPVPSDFDAGRGPIEPAYAGSWLAVDMIARRKGAAAVVRFYREAAGQGLPAAFSDVLGVGQAAFVAQWRAAITDLARSSTPSPTSGTP